MSNRVVNILLIVILILMCVNVVQAFRVQKPYELTEPITSEKISQLNKYLEELWDMQNGRIELDVVTTTKTDANNGELWIMYTGGTYKLQYKANDTIYTLTP